ncbi:class I SAM-dependent methyltransferase [bacterium]|nr:class I SAM-dependent methyltransferase [bacterium]MBU1651684.1 class I SAM-dependent methyltransferase [bacterium]MBU1882146.1 class I SAM-dependent methyltransferase [bacterium]
MQNQNVYDDPQRAASYDKLEFDGTYYLAYRDIPGILATHVNGNRALDFGCGAGRSTRFLKQLGFETIGIDVASDMIQKAEANDPSGQYQLIESGDFSPLEDGSFDLVLSAFTFDNISDTDQKLKTFREIFRVLKPEGFLLNLVSSLEIYLHEWVSFSTKDFPENRFAKSGDPVKIIITDIDDKRPVIDTVFDDAAYRDLYERSGFRIIDKLKPLASGEEPFNWVNETKIAPWIIYVLSKI